MKHTSRVRLSNPWLWAALLSSILFFWGKAWARDTGSETDPGRTGGADRSLSAEQQGRVLEAYGRLPLHFIANQGQKDSGARYYAQGGGRALFFTRQGVTFAWQQSGKPEPRWKKGKDRSRPEARRKPRRESPSKSIQLLPLGMLPEVELAASDPLEGKVNYLQGNDPAKWRTDIPTWQAVVYREAYPGIDLKFYGNGRQVEYDVIVRPGADPGRVQFQCRGARGLKLLENGDLSIQLSGGGELVQKKPLIYQEIGGRRVIREGSFELARGRGACGYGFAVAAYNKDHPLIIDPVLVYSTYLGGGASEWPKRNDDRANGIAVDQAGCAYITGYTGTSDFPTQNPLQTQLKSGTHAFVAKLSAAGNALVYATYLGGSMLDSGAGIAVDQAGCAYVTGKTCSNDFPVKNPLQAQLKGNVDAFVAKLSAAGNDLVYATYLGGTSDEYGQGIAVDQAGCAYVTGETHSTNFPTKKPLQAKRKSSTDAFVAKLTPDGNALVYATYLGGGNIDSGRGIAVDQAGCAYVTGVTESANFPTKKPLQAKRKGESDAFVAKFSAAGNALVYATYLGGTNDEDGHGIAVDQAGCAYVTGYTSSNDFPVKNPLQAQLKGNADAFVAKFSADGKALVYASYLGGSRHEYGFGIAVDQAGCAYVTGLTDSDDFPTQNPLQAQLKGETDAFVAKLSAAGNALVYATYLGGSEVEGVHNNNISIVEYGTAIAVDPAGCAYVAGVVWSDDFPTENPFQDQHKGGEDAFVAKIGEP